MAALLFVDQLGSKARWTNSGRPAAADAFRAFRDLAHESFQRVGTGSSIVAGGVEADSVALVFAHVHDALRGGVALFRNAFLAWQPGTGPRWWLRGVIVDAPAEVPLRREEPWMHVPLVKEVHYSDHLLDAIAAEKSGFKGMRLLVQSSILNSSVRESWKVGALYPFRRLEHSSYPELLEGRFEDVLWMAEPDDRLRGRLSLQAKNRLRWSSRSAEEFLHAAATQVVFNECEAIEKSFAIENPEVPRARVADLN